MLGTYGKEPPHVSILEGAQVGVLGKICVYPRLESYELMGNSLLIVIIPVYWRVHKSVSK